MYVDCFLVSGWRCQHKRRIWLSKELHLPPLRPLLKAQEHQESEMASMTWSAQHLLTTLHPGAQVCSHRLMGLPESCENNSTGLEEWKRHWPSHCQSLERAADCRSRRHTDSFALTMRCAVLFSSFHQLDL